MDLFSRGTIFMKSEGAAVFVEWEIPDFKSFLQGNETSSPVFEMRNKTWRLGFFQSGSMFAVLQQYDHTDFRTYDHTITYQISLQMINEGEIYQSFRMATNFQKAYSSHSISIEDLLQNMTSNKLTVLFIAYPEVDGGWTRRNISQDGANSRMLSSSSSEGTDILISQIEGLFLNRENSDFIIKVGDREFPVHKAILSARSPVLSAMLHSDMSEKKNSTTDIVDCEPDIFERFLLYLYSGRLDELSWDNVIDLYTLGDKYDLEHLRKTCVRYMEDNLCLDAFYSALRLAVRHNLSTLIDRIKEFFIKNANAILTTTQWQLLLKEHSDICNEIMIKYVANSKVI